MDLTQEIILQHGRLSPYKGKLENPTVKVKLENPLCGDSLRVDIRIVKDQVVDACFSGEGCLISQAAASLLVGEILRVKNLNKIKKFNEETVFKLLGISLTLSRTQCALLSLRALKKAFKIIP